MADNKPGFQVIEHEKIYQGRAFNVSRLLVKTPNGEARHYDLVDHPDSISIVPVDEEGCIWFVRQWRLGVDGDLLELPAGVLEPGEEPLPGAEREIREETGMAANEMTILGSYYLTPGYCNEYMTVFLARDLYPDPLDMDSDEYIDLVKIPFQKAFEMAEQGQFYDSKTLAALFLARPRLLG